MAEIYLYNSLTRRKEVFAPINPPTLGIYACGPTVYDYQHIGNLRRYVGDDILRNVLKLNGYEVKYVMNITDVGHLTSDADTGEDKLEKSAREQGKSAHEIAKFYEENFFEQTDELNIKRPDIVCKATEHIKEQIEMIGQIEKNGYAYKTDDGIYFDTSKLSDYSKLAGDRGGIRPGTRIDVAGKKHPTDFALWKFSPKDAKRQMEWTSPWGLGFPGWHIECSAMSRKYLGDAFDIHTGGVDHISIHHTNEIAQSEGATGKLPARFWIHHEFLQVDGGKMAKSLGNTYTVDDVVKKGFSPLALRYLFLTAHYRDPLNFTWDTLKGAEISLERLRSQVSGLKEQEKRSALSDEKNRKIERYREDFTSSLEDDLNTPKALAGFWEMLKSNISSQDKYDLAIFFDEILGLGLRTLVEVKVTNLPASGVDVYSTPTIPLSTPIISKLDQRELARKQGDFKTADTLRIKVEEEGIKVEDTISGIKITPKK